MPVAVGQVPQASASAQTSLTSLLLLRPSPSPHRPRSTKAPAPQRAKAPPWAPPPQPQLQQSRPPSHLRHPRARNGRKMQQRPLLQAAPNRQSRTASPRIVSHHFAPFCPVVLPPDRIESGSVADRSSARACVPVVWRGLVCFLFLCVCVCVCLFVLRALSPVIGRRERRSASVVRRLRLLPLCTSSPNGVSWTIWTTPRRTR